MKQSQTIAKNAAFGVLGGVLGGGLNVVSVLIAAHMLRLSDFGSYSYLLAIATVFQFICDFGLSNILVREIARHPEDQERLLGSVKLLFWVIFGLGAVGLAGVTSLLPISPQLRLLSWIMGLGYLWMLHSVGYLALLRANQENEFNSMGFVLHKILLVIFIWSTLSLGGGLLGVVVSHVAANFLQWIFYHFAVTLRHVRGVFRYEPALWKRLLIESIPMGGGVALRQITWQADIFVAAHILTLTQLGLFSGPFRLLVGITMISSFMAVPLFPVFVRLAKEKPVDFGQLYQRTLKWFFMVSFPIMAVTVAWPQVWVDILLGHHFQEAIPAFRILGLASVPIFISVLYPYVYSSLDRQFDYFVIVAITLVVRIGVNYYMLSHFGIRGGCWGIVMVETGLFLALGLRLLALGYGLALSRTIVKPALAGMVAWLILHFGLKFGLPGIIISAVLSAVAYLIVLAVTRVLTDQEIAHLKDGLRFLTPYLQSVGLLKRRAAAVGPEPLLPP